MDFCLDKQAQQHSSGLSSHQEDKESMSDLPRYKCGKRRDNVIICRKMLVEELMKHFRGTIWQYGKNFKIFIVIDIIILVQELHSKR